MVQVLFSKNCARALSPCIANSGLLRHHIKEANVVSLSYVLVLTNNRLAKPAPLQGL